MSLLMDALKKAEQDKKKAAERLARAEDDAHKEKNADTDTIAATGETEAAEEKKLHHDTVSLSLQPIDDNVESPVTTGAEKRVAEAPSLADTQEAQLLDDDLTTENEIVQHTAEILAPSKPTGIEGLSTDIPASASDDTFHGIALQDQEEPVEAFRETLPGIPAADLVRDIGGEHQPTPVAAQTVFSAGATSRSGQSFKWPVLIMLVVIALMAYVTLEYFTKKPAGTEIPSPTVARGIETRVVEPPLENPLPEVDPGTETLVTGRPDAGQPPAESLITAPAPGAEATVTSTPDSTTDITTETPAAETAEMESMTTAQAVATSEAGQAPGIAMEMEGQNDTEAVVPGKEEDSQQKPAPVMAESEPVMVAAKPPDAEVLPERISVDPELIHITKTTSPEQRNIAITRAYADYVGGRYNDAENQYRKVLADMPDNRDALLGLAAIAMQKGDYEVAYKHYLHLLDLNPGDRVSLTALVNLSGNKNPGQSESLIKSLLGQGSGDAYLYFALGNIYAYQSRWPEAQQSFFNAYRQEAGNPDYALNLAVSLDHIGQYKAALEYYDVALGLADTTTPAFDTASIIARIQALNAIVNTGL